MMKYMKYSTIGIELSLSVIIGGAIGYWLDKFLGTDPWMLIFWTICGIATGFRSLYRTAKNFMKETQDDDDQRSD